MKTLYKRILAGGLAAGMILSLAACGSSSSDDEDTTEEETTEETEEAEEEETEETEAEEEETEETEEAEEEEEEESSDDEEPVYGGTLTMYYGEFYNMYDPSIPVSYGYALWFESLWSMDWTSDFAYESAYWTYENVAGQIADTWEIADDYSYITVTIRDDIYFQTKEDEEYNIFEGRNLLASDIKYTYDRLLGIGSGWDEPVECEMDWPDELYMIESIEVVDDYTVTFNFNTTSEVALNIFMTTPINITGPEWDELTEDQQGDWHYAIGTGAYILTDCTVGTSMTFTKNENYYDYDERYPENKLPYIDTIELVYIADSSNLLAQFVAGEIDSISSSSEVFSSSEQEQLEDTMEEGSYVEYVYATNPPSSIALKCNFEPFDDINVRTAMQMAINSDEIMTGYYGLSEDYVIPSLWATTLLDYTTVGTWDEELQSEYEYDPEGALELLEEAGYADGFEFTVALAPTADTDLYVLVQTYYAELGITMNIEQTSEIMEAISISTDSTDPTCVSSTHGGKENISTIKLTTSSRGSNYTFNHNNEEYESLIDDFEQCLTLADQNEVAQELDLMYAEQHWDIALGGYTELTDYITSRVKGYDGQKIGANQYRRFLVARMWLDDEA